MNRRWVLFGFSRAIGDVYDVIHAHGDQLAAVVFNVEVDPSTLASQLDPIPGPVARVPLAEFTPGGEDVYSFGFFIPEMRVLVQQLNERFGLEFENLVHPSAEISSLATLGRGLLINPLVVVSANAVIGNHSRLNRAVSIGHSTVIEDYCHIAAGATVAGHCRVEAGTFVGAGSVIKDETWIGSNCVIGAGSVVVDDIPEGVVAFGHPARVVRENR